MDWASGKKLWKRVKSPFGTERTDRQRGVYLITSAI